MGLGGGGGCDMGGMIHGRGVLSFQGSRVIL